MTFPLIKTFFWLCFSFFSRIYKLLESLISKIISSADPCLEISIYSFVDLKTKSKFFFYQFLFDLIKSPVQGHWGSDLLLDNWLKCLAAIFRVEIYILDNSCMDHHRPRLQVHLLAQFGFEIEFVFDDRTILEQGTPINQDYRKWWLSGLYLSRFRFPF